MVSRGGKSQFVMHRISTYGGFGLYHSSTEKQKVMENPFKSLKEGHLAGSVSRARDSGSQDCKFQPHVGCGDYLKIQS